MSIIIRKKNTKELVASIEEHDIIYHDDYEVLLDDEIDDETVVNDRAAYKEH